jgi:hypothetical protein
MQSQLGFEIPNAQHNMQNIGHSLLQPQAASTAAPAAGEAHKRHLTLSVMPMPIITRFLSHDASLPSPRTQIMHTPPPLAAAAADQHHLTATATTLQHPSHHTP